MQQPTRRCALGLIALLVTAGVGLSAEPAGAAERGEPVVVLDTLGFWRMHHTLKPPVIRSDGGLKPVLMDQAWLNLETPDAPAGWTSPDFDDGGWTRGPARKACRTSYLARLCLRGKFEVTDPAKVRDLRLSADYHGGVVFYVNGKAIGGANVPTRSSGGNALADGYPEEAFINEKGGLLVEAGYRLAGGRAGRPSAESERRMGLRKRSLEGVAVPPGLLHRGVNVVAVEVIRAPYHKVLEKHRRPETNADYDNTCRYDLAWNTCEILAVRLTAERADGLVPNAARPEGFQVWNSDALMADMDLDFGDPCEPLRPMRLVGPRGGIYSGKVVAGSTEPMCGLRAEAGELKGPSGSIAASHIRTRYGLPWGSQEGFRGVHGNPYVASPTQLEAMAESPPAAVAVSTRELEPSMRPRPVWGAVVPVWVTVAVPRDARAGTYTGTVTIRAAGQAAVDVPLEVEVVDWTLPAPQDYRTWVDMIESPDTLALEYNVPLWSEEHWKLVARSLRLMGEVGNKTLYVPLIAHTNLGNAETMVRWIEKGDDKFDFDFSVMERYLDLALELMGKPSLVVLNVWDLYLMSAGDGMSDEQARRSGERVRHVRMAKNLEAHGGKYGVGPLVTVLDPASGKTEEAYLPRYDDPASKAVWGELFRQLRARLAKRGLERAPILGMLTDAWPSREDTQFFKDVAPGMDWMIHSHDGHPPGKLLHGLTPVSYQAQVWGVRFADDAPYKYAAFKGRLYGWQRPERFVLFERFTNTDAFPASKWRATGEYTITGDRRGIGRLGADFWSVIKDRSGRRAGRVPARYPEAHWRNLNICTSLLAPGPNGPASTNRYEHFREGIQQCEARILIERALTDDRLKARLGAALARRCQEALDERLMMLWKSVSNLQLNGREFGQATCWRWATGVDGHRWFVGSGWQERSRTLYCLAGEVARKLGR